MSETATAKRTAGPVSATPCILLTGKLTHEGYGRWHKRGPDRGKKVHRVLWERVHGPIPKGFVPDHLCRVRNCINLDHMEIVTEKENTLRGVSVPGINSRKTACEHGHELAGVNLGIDYRGNRFCRTCARAKYLRYHRKHANAIKAKDRVRNSAIDKSARAQVALKTPRPTKAAPGLGFLSVKGGPGRI